MITPEASNRLYADGWRSETAPLDGPRIVRDLGESGVYATIVAGQEGGEHRYYWSIWSWGSGFYLAGGKAADPEDAAAQAIAWDEE